MQTLFPSKKNVTPFTTSHFVEKECLSGGQPSTNDQIVYLICSQQGGGIHKLRWQERGVCHTNIKYTTLLHSRDTVDTYKTVFKIL